jgi:hypothetical protein
VLVLRVLAQQGRQWPGQWQVDEWLGTFRSGQVCILLAGQPAVELDVSRATAAASAVTRASAQAKGKEIAGSAKVGEHVIAQTRSDDTDQFALGVFVDAGKGSPVIAQATKRGKLQTKFGSVFCNDGDVVLAVRWLVRDESDAERRTFYEPSDERRGLLAV